MRAPRRSQFVQKHTKGEFLLHGQVPRRADEERKATGLKPRNSTKSAPASLLATLLGGDRRAPAAKFDHVVHNFGQFWPRSTDVGQIWSTSDRGAPESARFWQKSWANLATGAWNSPQACCQELSLSIVRTTSAASTAERDIWLAISKSCSWHPPLAAGTFVEHVLKISSSWELAHIPATSRWIIGDNTLGRNFHAKICLRKVRTHHTATLQRNMSRRPSRSASTHTPDSNQPAVTICRAASPHVARAYVSKARARTAHDACVRAAPSCLEQLRPRALLREQGPIKQRDAQPQPWAAELRTDAAHRLAEARWGANP